MAWIIVIVAGALEVVWAAGLKHGFTRLGPSVLTISTMAASMYLLYVSARTIPIGTAYAVWTGIGASGTAIYGMAFLAESRDVRRLACLVLIVAGTLGLKFLGEQGKG